jgi:hypothetical protein
MPHPPAGFLKFVVSNVKELELLMMHNRKYCAEIAHNVSTLKRKAIAERAAEVRMLHAHSAHATLARCCVAAGAGGQAPGLPGPPVTCCVFGWLCLRCCWGCLLCFRLVVPALLLGLLHLFVEGMLALIKGSGRAPAAGSPQQHQRGSNCGSRISGGRHGAGRSPEAAWQQRQRNAVSVAERGA